MLILNDRTPIHGHDPILIADQIKEILEAQKCSCVLLDLQRPGMEENAALAKHLVDTLPCPVGVSEGYAEGHPCPVFLPPVPPDTPLEAHLEPWQGREIWLETALDGMEIFLTEQGATRAPLPFCAPLPNAHRDEKLHCHYHIKIETSHVRFTLYRTREDIGDLLEEAAHLGVIRTIGLWQEWDQVSPH